MQEWQKRVIEERDELYGKVGRLDIFISGPNFCYEVGIDERYRLKLQLMAMKMYLTVLNDRIDHFPKVINHEVRGMITA